MFHISCRYKNVVAATMLEIDEISMVPNEAVTVIDDVCRRAKSAKEHDDGMFGGMPLLVGGDLRQLCPVLTEGQTERDSHIRYSELMSIAVKKTLKTNMRADPEEQEFATLLEEIGEGRQESHPDLPEGSFLVPTEWVIESCRLDDLIEFVFGTEYSIEGADCAILTHLNKNCKVINNRVTCVSV
jgi:PIF1-like helicase